MKVNMHIYDGVTTDPSYEWFPDPGVDLNLLMIAINNLVASMTRAQLQTHILAVHTVTTINHTTAVPPTTTPLLPVV